MSECKPRDEEASSLEEQLRVKPTQRKTEHREQFQLKLFEHLDPAVPEAVYTWTFTVQEALNYYYYLFCGIYIVIENQVA